MNTLPIYTHTDPVLRKKGAVIHDISAPDIQKLIDDMIPTMYLRDGVGLAAPQVGASVQLAVIVPDPHDWERYHENAKDALVIINPRIVKHSWLKNKDEEGCLSVPGVYGSVSRWNSVRIEYQDRNGKHILANASGLMARIFQHEIDHLNGILFIDKAEKIYQTKPL